MWNDLRFRLRALFWRNRVEVEADEELRFHFEKQVERYVASGTPRGEAIRRARLDFGGHEQLKEELREARGVSVVESTLRDIRYAMRILTRTPVISCVAILSLALGIGANTAIFSLIDSVMLRMLPVANPEQLALIKFRSPASAHLRQSATNPIWEELRDHQDAFSGVIAWSPSTFDLADGGQVNNIHGIYASGSYFTTLGVRPAVGRLIAASDDVHGCGGVAVLSYGFWQGRYAGAPSIVGSSIRLNGHSFPIIGVAKRGFSGTEIGVPLDVAIPICAEGILDGKDSMLDDRSSWWLEMMGRLKTGITVGQADARMKVISPQIFGAVIPQDWPAKYQDVFRKYTFAISSGDTGTGGNYGFREQYTRPLEILMYVVELVLLIACANIASLLLARSAARQKEIAVRLSLGASRGRLVRQALTESVVLSTAGAILGVFFARWCSSLMVRFVSTQQSQVFLDLHMDGRVLGFTSGIAVLCGLLFGILPALRGTRIDAMAAMKEGQAQSAGGQSHSSAVRWIVSAQVALSVILLIVAGLFVRTFANLIALDAGFDLRNVLIVETNIHNGQIPEPARASLYGQMLAKLQAIPGVVSASQCWMTPLSGHQWDNSVTIPGRPLPGGFDPDTFLNWVTPGYFETMRTPVLEGRAFDAHDTSTSTPVVIVNQLLARRYFGRRSPIGEHLLAGAAGGGTSKMLRQPMEIIGVVQDSKYNSLDEDFLPEAYFPLSQIQQDVAESTAFEIRTALEPSALIPAVRDAMGSVNKLASLQFSTLKQEAGDTVTQEHLLAVLSGFFGALALLLTAIGLYGVMAYAVTLRTHEIGIRLALGAPRQSILWLVLRDVAIVLSGGIVAGVGISLVTVGLLQKLLFGLAARDTATIAASVAVLSAVALVAGYLPARRAMRVDPMVALRYE